VFPRERSAVAALLTSTMRFSATVATGGGTSRVADLGRVRPERAAKHAVGVVGLRRMVARAVGVHEKGRPRRCGAARYRARVDYSMLKDCSSTGTGPVMMSAPLLSRPV